MKTIYLYRNKKYFFLIFPLILLALFYIGVFPFFSQKNMTAAELRSNYLPIDDLSFLRQTKQIFISHKKILNKCNDLLSCFIITKVNPENIITLHLKATECSYNGCHYKIENQDNVNPYIKPLFQNSIAIVGGTDSFFKVSQKGGRSPMSVSKAKSFSELDKNNPLLKFKDSIFQFSTYSDSHQPETSLKSAVFVSKDGFAITPFDLTPLCNIKARIKPSYRDCPLSLSLFKSGELIGQSVPITLHHCSTLCLFKIKDLSSFKIIYPVTLAMDKPLGEDPAISMSYHGNKLVYSRGGYAKNLVVDKNEMGATSKTRDGHIQDFLIVYPESDNPLLLGIQTTGLTGYPLSLGVSIPYLVQEHHLLESMKLELPPDDFMPTLDPLSYAKYLGLKPQIHTPVKDLTLLSKERLVQSVFGILMRGGGMGTGVFVSENKGGEALLATAHHVVDSCPSPFKDCSAQLISTQLKQESLVSKIAIKFDVVKCSNRYVGDFCLLKVKGLKDMPIFSRDINWDFYSSQNNPILAFGNPDLSGLKYTLGRYSPDHSSLTTHAQAEYFCMNAVSGYSGGPLIDLYTGKVLGIARVVWNENHACLDTKSGVGMRTNVMLVMYPFKDAIEELDLKTYIDEFNR